MKAVVTIMKIILKTAEASMMTSVCYNYQVETPLIVAANQSGQLF